VATGAGSGVTGRGMPSGEKTGVDGGACTAGAGADAGEGAVSPSWVLTGAGTSAGDALGDGDSGLHLCCYSNCYLAGLGSVLLSHLLKRDERDCGRA
jgi:hypothetical protein